MLSLKYIAKCNCNLESFIVVNVAVKYLKAQLDGRKERLEIHYDDPFWLEESFEQEDNDALMLEAGDVLWQLSGLCSIMGWRLEDVAKLNLDKLQDRQQRNQIDGNGDYR